MSLNWNLNKIENWEALYIKVVDSGMGGYRYPTPEDKEEDLCEILNPVTNSLIWATIAVEMGQITEKNWMEFYTRLKVFEMFNGPMLPRGVELTPAIIKRHIGLSTNVYSSVADWNKRLKRMQQEAGAKVTETWEFKRKEEANADC